MFFERFRQAQARLPAGLIRTGPGAGKAALAAVEQRLEQPLPGELRSFLESFDGADLFHGSIAIAGIGERSDPSLMSLNAGAQGPSETLIFAEAELGDRFTLDERGRVWRLRAGSDERILAGSSFGKWLEAVVAREQILYDREGEFRADAFEPDGEEVTPQTARRQAERALRHDPGSAEGQHDLATALRRLGRHREAAEALVAATALDPGNPWPWFDLGRVLLEHTHQPDEAMRAFATAASYEEGIAAARLLAWTARAAEQAANRPELERARREAVARHAGIEGELRRAMEAAEDEDAANTDALNEARALLTALTGQPVPPPRRRLPIITSETGDSDRDPKPAPPQQMSRPRAQAAAPGKDRKRTPGQRRR